MESASADRRRCQPSLSLDPINIDIAWQEGKGKGKEKSHSRDNKQEKEENKRRMGCYCACGIDSLNCLSANTAVLCACLTECLLSLSSIVFY